MDLEAEHPMLWIGRRVTAVGSGTVFSGGEAVEIDGEVSVFVTAVQLLREQRWPLVVAHEWEEAFRGMASGD